MNPVPFSVMLIAIAVSGAAGFGTGWTTNGWKHDAAEKSKIEDQLAQVQKDVAAATKSGENTEKALARLKPIQRTYYNETKNELTKSVYIDPNCDLPPSGWMLRNKLIREANTASSDPDDKVSADSGDKAGQKKQWRSFLGGSGPDSPVLGLPQETQ